MVKLVIPVRVKVRSYLLEFAVASRSTVSLPLQSKEYKTTIFDLLSIVKGLLFPFEVSGALSTSTTCAQIQAIKTNIMVTQMRLNRYHQPYLAKKTILFSPMRYVLCEVDTYGLQRPSNLKIETIGVQTNALNWSQLKILCYWYVHLGNTFPLRLFVCLIT